MMPHFASKVKSFMNAIFLICRTDATILNAIFLILNLCYSEINLKTAPRHLRQRFDSLQDAGLRQVQDSIPVSSFV